MGHPEVVGSVDQFKDTEIVAHPDIPLDPNKNVIWCGTMPLAWNEAITVLKGPLHFTPSIPLAEMLNNSGFSTDDLDADSYVVKAGYKLDHIEDKFRNELRSKFGDDAKPPRLDTDDAPATPADVALYAYLLKNLEFPTPFNNNIPLSFEGKKVANFGFGFENGALPDLKSEVKLLAYSSDDDFVLQIDFSAEYGT